MVRFLPIEHAAAMEIKYPAFDPTVIPQGAYLGNPAVPAVRLLLAQVRRPEAQAGLGPPLHNGAAGFFDKDKPSFLQANADYVGLLVALVLMVASWIWEIKRWMQNQQKNAADQYSNRVVALMGSAQAVTSHDALEAIWREMLTILEGAVRDLDADKLSEESFDSFRSILQIAMDVTRDRRNALAVRGQAARAAH